MNLQGKWEWDRIGWDMGCCAGIFDQRELHCDSEQREQHSWCGGERWFGNREQS